MAMITAPIPDVNGAKSVEQKIEMLLDSYFMLRKEIEYGMHNIGLENFDKDFELVLDDYKGKLSNIISTNEVFLSRIEDAEGNISTILQTASLIDLRVSDAEDNISTLQQTANSITSTVSSHTQTISGIQINISQIEQTATQISSIVAQHTLDINGLSTNYSSILQTVNSISSTVSSHTGSISTLQQTANNLTTRINSAEGNISTIQQTANSLTTRISDAEGNISTIQQTTTGITAAINATKLEFNSSGLTIKNGGFKILDGSTQVFTVSTSGVVGLGGGKIVIYNTPSSSTEAFKVDSNGYVLSRGFYAVNPNVSGSLSYSNPLFAVRTSYGGEVFIGTSTNYYRYYVNPGTYGYYHTFRGKVDIGATNDVVRIKGYDVVFDTDGFLKRA
jgi:predicted  nucleic acid-binding Zn-ribbon protein